MRDSHSISHILLDEIITTIEVIGFEKTIKTLQNAKNYGSVSRDSDIEYILDNISKITSVSKDRILFGSDRSDDRKLAIAACVYFIKNEYAYSLSELKIIFNKDASQLSRYNKIVSSVPEKPKTQFDKKLTNIIRKMKLLINEKKNNNG
jgi:hypothetical protein